jgi:hypothetical protein
MTHYIYRVFRKQGSKGEVMEESFLRRVLIAPGRQVRGRNATVGPGFKQQPADAGILFDK